MFVSITQFFDRMVQRYLPDAFLFAIILTLVVFIGGIFMADNTPLAMMQHWGDGFWDLLDFSMQMALIVVTGYILANTPIVKSILSRLALFAHTPAQAIVLVTVVATIACLINYGFGLVLGALFARHVVRNVPTVDFRLLIASAYSGFIVWHGGLSGSVPLTINTPGHFLEDMLGTIPITETIFSSYNIFIVVAFLISLPLVNLLLLRGTDQTNKIDPSFLEEAASREDESTPHQTPADRLENSQLISMVIGFLGLGYVVYFFATQGLDLNLNIVNFTFLFLGILLHRTPRRYLRVVSDAVKNAGGIIIQFPFYAGIMGMMVESGLSEQLSLFFINISTEVTYPLFAFLSAGIVNFFVPSGGGQWAVQGSIMIPAALEIGVNPARTAMAVAWGDAWTNMIQPFWTLPLLAIAGLKVRDIMGFCLVILFWSLIPISIGLLFI
ncbi:short-chain fatty acid transporter [Natribacillus halophilus]|uniref:Short-chain fatty acids transporter n=1 Tax=Natribacillus halophilus TaxID=549003 RepID=A0A1G8Q2Z9_9BACI|nr:short-chain fatty acid transporter [Natribacillus halophilus]SDI98460.1 short-chain fatty acids transporter [Natribacillus halophilus]